jgi:hypothetical protein
MPGVADIVRQFGSAYRARYDAAMPPSHRRALRDLAACRTPALGGQVHCCDTCGYEHYVYHSCRIRPTCPPDSIRFGVGARGPIARRNHGNNHPAHGPGRLRENSIT